MDVNVIDTRNLEPGPALWIAQVYNEDLLLFGLLVVVVMALAGLLLGFGFDRLRRSLSADRGEPEHAPGAARAAQP